jgi:hypothetical protein
MSNKECPMTKERGISNIQQGMSNDEGAAPFALNIGYSLLAIGNCNQKAHPMKTLCRVLDCPVVIRMKPVGGN